MAWDVADGQTMAGDAAMSWVAAPASDVDTADDVREQARASFHGGRRAPGPGEQPAARYSGRHASPRKTARIRARQAVPAAVVAAAFAAGAVAYTLAGSGQPQAAQLNAAISTPLILSGATHTGTGRADTAAAAMIRATKSPGTARPAATPSRTASATPSASHAAVKAAVTSPAASTASATPTASSSSAPAATTLNCDLNYGLLPANVTSIVSFLLANGYTDNAAAGIAGNIYQESKGYPESVGMGGGGLIGWTPLPSGYITGNPTADLETQLAGILTYNQQWSSYLPALNSAASPADAAYIYVTDFERAGIPAASTREAAAEDVASACGI